jgi:hypothetical protein
MKKLSIIVLFVFQLGCNKKDNPPVYSSNFSFKANNSVYAWNFDFAHPSSNGFGLISRHDAVGWVPGGYMLSGFKPSQDISLYFFLETNAVATGTYKSVTTVSTPYIQSGYIVNGTYYAPLNIGDSVMVTISSLSDNKASGTFNAVMHDSTRSIKLEITDGRFNNLIISN